MPFSPGAEIHRSYGQAFHDCLHLIQGETIRASWIAVAEGASEIAFVGQAEPERNTGISVSCEIRTMKTGL